MKIGVSGASGQLGSAVVQALVETVVAEDLVAISRTPKTDRAYAGRLGNYDQPETLVAAYQGLDRLLLIPGPDLQPGIRSRQMLAALDAAARAQVGHVFLLSATGTQREEEPAVGAAYWHSEQALIKSAIPAWTILRMSYFSETLVEEVRMALTAGGLAALADSRVSFVSRSDVAKAAAAALTSEGHEGALYQLTVPEVLHSEAVCRLVAQHIQRPFTLNVMPADALRAGLLKTGLSDVIADAVVSMKARQARGAYDIVSGDIARLTGYAPCSLAQDSGENSRRTEAVVVIRVLGAFIAQDRKLVRAQNQGGAAGLQWPVASPLARCPRHHFAAPVDESPHDRGKVPAVWVKNGNWLRFGMRRLQHADQSACSQVISHHVAGHADQAQAGDTGFHVGVGVIDAYAFPHGNGSGLRAVLEIPMCQASGVAAVVAHRDVLLQVLEVARRSVLRKVIRGAADDPVKATDAPGHQL